MLIWIGGKYMKELICIYLVKEEIPCIDIIKNFKKMSFETTREMVVALPILVKNSGKSKMLFSSERAIWKPIIKINQDYLI